MVMVIDTVTDVPAIYAWAVGRGSEKDPSGPNRWPRDPDPALMTRVAPWRDPKQDRYHRQQKRKALRPAWRR